MKTMRKLCAFLLALATLLSLTGCVNHNWSAKTSDETLVAAGDDTIAAGVYIYYMMTAYNDASAKLDDEKADVLTATIDGKVGREWILEEAKNYCRRHFAVKALCAERNITLSEEDTTNLNNTLNYMISYYGTFFEEAGISTASVQEVYENSYLYSDLLYSLYDGEGEMAVKEEEIKKYFSENYFAYKAIDASYTYTVDGESKNYSDEEIKTRKTLLKEYFEEASKLDKADIDDFNKKFQNRNVKEGEKEKDVAKLTLQFATEDTTTNYGDTFFEDLKKAAEGDFLHYEIKDKGSYLIQKLDEYSDDSKYYKETRETCIAAMVEDDFISLLDGQASTMDIIFNDKALGEYSLDTLIEQLNSDE